MSSSGGKPVRAGKPLQAKAGGPPRPPRAGLPRSGRASGFWAANKATILLVSVTALFAVVGVGTTLFITLKLAGMALPPERQAASGAPPESQRATSSVAPETPRNETAPETTGEDPPVQEATETEETPSDPQEPPAESQNEDEEEEPKEPPPPPPSEQRDPFEDIKKRNRVLPLPKRDRSMNALLGPQELARLFVDSADDCRLAILGSEQVLKGGLTFEISREDAEDETPTWKVVNKPERGIGGKKPVGTFSLKGDSLQFKWPSIPQAQSVKLRYCVLEIQVGEQTERCILTKPEEVKPAAVDVLRAPQVELPLDPGRILDKDVLRLDLQLHGFPKHDAKRVEGLKVGGEKGVVWIFPPDGIEAPDERFPEIQVTFDLDERQPRLSLDAFVALGPEQQPITRSWLDKFSAEWDSDRVENFDRDLVKIGKTVAEKQRVVRAWDEAVQQLEAKREEAKKEVAVAALNSKIAQIKDRSKPQAERELVKANGEKARVQALRDEAEKQHKCGEALKKRLDDLKADGTIDFRVYAEIEGQEVVLLRSEGFSSNQRGEGGNE